MTSAIPHQFQLVVCLGVTHNDVGSHLRVLLVRDTVHGKELQRFVVKAVVLAQSVIEFFGIAANHGFIHQCRSAIFRSGAQQHAMNGLTGVRQAFKDRNRFLKLFVS